MFDWLRVLIAIIGTIIGAYTDHKTGEIPEKVTVPMIVLGIILSYLDYGLSGLAFPVIFSLMLFPFFYFGYLGGGDVFLFSGLSFLLPTYPEILRNILGTTAPIYPFPLLIFLLAGFVGVIYFTLKYGYIALKNGQPKREDYFKATAYTLAFGLLLAYLHFFIYPLPLKAMIFYTLLLAFMFVATLTKNVINEKLFLKKVAVSKLEPEDIIAWDYETNEKVKEIFSVKKVVSEKEIEKLKAAKVKYVHIYNNLPHFGPSILAALLIALVVGDIFVLLW